MNRRLFLERSSLGIIGLQTSAFQKLITTESKTFVYISSWTKGAPGQGGEGGIHVFSFNHNDGSLKHIHSIESELNFGNICISHDNKFLFAVEEIKDFNHKTSSGGGVYAYIINQQNGSLSFINKQPTMGAFPCYLSVDKETKLLVIANHGSYDSIMKTVRRENGNYEVIKNYDDGSVAVFPINEDGSISPITYLDIHEGSGTHPFFQQSPHPHAVIFSKDDSFAVVCDKGNDSITFYSVDKNNSKLSVKTVYKTTVGVGPRHAVFHPHAPYLFVINEAVSSLTSYRFDAINGTITEINTLPTIPSSFIDTNYPADIRVHPNGKFIYGSNRGHDSIVSFEIDQNIGKLTNPLFTAIQGKTPREFNITASGDLMLVGNQDTNTVSCFSIDAKNGALKFLKKTDNIPKPVCIQFLNS